MKKKSLPKQLVSSKFIYIVPALLLGLMLLYKLGSLSGGVSNTEVAASTQAVGFHGLIHDPLYLTLKIIRSIVFVIFRHHGAYLTRLPNVILGLMTIISFSAIVYLWHGKRTAVISSIMFACSAWVLHVSRLASFDVSYLFAMTSVILGYTLLYEYESNRLIWYFNLLILGLIATIPGLIWLSLLAVYFERDLLKEGYTSYTKIYERALSLILLLIWPLYTIFKLGTNHAYKEWIGLPNNFPPVFHFLKQFVAVPTHLLVKGPLLPDVWLGRAPVLDAFSLLMLILGGYYYARRHKSSRSQLLGSLLVLCIILIGLGGSVSFSLIIPLAYLLIAMGLAYLMHSWKKVFPLNPVAKWVSLGIIVLAVALSCAYNLRAYFVAWPHNPTTYSTFDRYI